MIGGLSRLLKGFTGHKIILVTDCREAYRVVSDEIRYRASGAAPPHHRDSQLFEELRYELDDRNVEVQLSIGVLDHQAGMNRART